MNTYPEILYLSTYTHGEPCANGLPNQLWKIFTSEKDGFLNTIMTAYFISSSRSELCQQTKHRINLLFDEERKKEENKKKVKKTERAILSHNPFRNCKQPVFKLDILPFILDTFRKKLTPFLENPDDIGESNYSNILKAASNMLKCSIFLFKTNENNSSSFEYFRFVDNNSTWPAPRKLYIFLSILKTKAPDECYYFQNNFGFGISIEHAFSLRREAWNSIFKTVNISNDLLETIRKKASCNKYLIFKTDNITDELVEMIRKEVSYSENFLISLLQSSFVRIMPAIFEFPYIAMKLNEAGFNTDPLKTDEKGLSAFYYCCLLPDNDYFILLYNHASNNSHLSECSVRKPQPAILNALKNISKTFKNDILRSNSFLKHGNKKFTSLAFYKQIFYFNKFQIQIVEDIMKITENDLEGNVKTQQIMISILQKYCNNFYYNHSESNARLSKEQDQKFEDYLHFNDYYNFLDVFFAFLFFDNFLSLSFMKTSVDVDVFKDAASSLLLLVLSNKFFPFLKHGIDCKNCKLTKERCEKKLNFHRFVPFCYRESFLQSANKLILELNDLQQTDLNKSSDILRESLTDLPKVANEFITDRIRNYLTSVVRLSTKSPSVKKMLIVERVLQVMGELISNETVTECPVRYLLLSCFSKGLEAQLCNIRNHCLSKYRSNIILGRMEFEHDIMNFEKFRTEIEEMLTFFQPIQVSHFFNSQGVMIENGLGKAIVDYERAIISMKTRKGNVKDLKGMISTITIKENIIKDLKGIMSTKTQKQNSLFLRHKEDFKVLIENMMVDIRKTLQDIRSEFNSFETKYSSGKTRNKSEETKSDSEEWKNKSAETKNDSEKRKNKSAETKNDLEKRKNILKKTIINPEKTKNNKEKDNKDKIKGLQNKIKGQLKAFSYLLEYIVSNIENADLQNNFENFKSFLNGIVNFDSVLSLEGRILNILHKIHVNILNTFGNSFEPRFCECKLIKEVYEKMHKISFFSLSEEETIRSMIVEYVENSNRLKEVCLKSIESLSESSLKQNLSLIIMTNRERIYILDNYRSQPENAKRRLRNIKDVKIMEEGCNITEILKKKEYKYIHWKLKYKPGLNKKIQRVMNQKIHFLINRIDKLKTILIDEDKLISYLWSKGKSGFVKKHAKLLICQRYLRERDTRAALETLLFDCMNILNNEQMRYLWEKATNLFSGAYLRDILSHGNPFIEIAAGCLDPKDLPTALVDAVVEMIEDREALAGLTKLWSTYKICQLKDLIDFVEKEKAEKEPQLRKQIQSSPRWKQYVALLPVDR
ncbi:uncharacterized protein [Parasteatoda tepidariorum]|uniref:uncharacterized protein n=1 Tax=Parasteatoda tepidariorum TaxID=114398 RepID=UPI001C726E35|nr:uncharacterized protein LOC107456477 [Parasteatoda tepidariorum]